MPEEQGRESLTGHGEECRTSLLSLVYSYSRRRTVRLPHPARALLRERSCGRFSRNITLPEPVDEASSEARYTDSVLYLTLQKKRASQAKRITVH